MGEQPTDHAKRLRKHAERYSSGELRDYLLADTCEEAAEELERLTAELAKRQWQKIETAPASGHILLSAPHGYVTVGFRDVCGVLVCATIGRPMRPFTHWQPLPPAPEEGK